MISNTDEQLTLGGSTISGKDLIKDFTVSQPTIQLPDQSYGNGQNSLDAQIALRNLDTISNIKAGNFSYNSTGDIVVTGVGFTPKLVTFTAYDNSRTGGIGNMTAINQSYYRYGVDVGGTDYCIVNGNPTRSGLVYVSMDTDGFTVNCSYYNPGVTTYVNYVAFG